METAPHTLADASQELSLAAPGSLPDLHRRLRTLSRIANQLNTLRSERELVGKVVDLLLRAFPRSLSVDIVILEGEGDLSLLYTRRQNSALNIMECGGIDALPVDRRAHFAVPHVIPGDGRPDHGAMLSTPLLTDGNLIGLLVVEAMPAYEFGPADVDALSGVAAQVAMSVQNRRITHRMHAQRQLAQDLRAARRIQQGLLPRIEPFVNGFRVQAEYRPAFDVGGDFYDVLPGAPAVLTAVIGDVAGKGISGALWMARVASEVRRLARDHAEPRALLTALNQVCAIEACDDLFVTAAVVQLDVRRRRLTVANAGHVPPLLRAASGHVVSLSEASGAPLGMLPATDPAASYEQEVYPLDLGDTVVLVTDGIADALRSDGDELGFEALRAVLKESPRDLRSMHERVLREVEGRSRGAICDDITLLSVEATPRAR